ncbi:3,4-dihydroxy 2-butanone 4-phosphate synthase [Friedmanniomyces endolithicus]|nr:3,4-dihydroxy 2-butanone 4-phosphate synthase [Friedmanniomyces endolithicus]KAK1818275.1 3,4-dihydroxy 2-butanone 4-phosphate synthase [Friedmanniomyces endolithicus]
MAATTNGEQSFSSIPDAVEAFGMLANVIPPPSPPLTPSPSPARGEFLIVLDSPHRENEGDLIIAAADLTPSKAAFLIRHTSGYLCAPLTPSLAARLALPQMVSENLDPNRTAYTITIDAAEDVTTGISAQDRSTTCLKLADPKATKESFRRPGHVVPLQAREGGVRARAGHTEAAVDLCRLAGKELVGVIAELVEDGEGVEGRAEMKGGFGMMRRDGCLAFARRYGLRVITIEDLIRYLESEGKGKV